MEKDNGAGRRRKPGPDPHISDARARRIAREFKTLTLKQLAVKFDVSISTIRRALARVDAGKATEGGAR